MKTLLLILCLMGPPFCSAQYTFEPGPDHPFGLPNPEAPEQLTDWAPMIGECDCDSESRKPDGSWADPVKMIWRFKYIMNGMAVQDETLKADGKHSGSIRQFIPDSTRWYVHYYNSATPSVTLPAWEGVKNEVGNIILYRPQKAPNGMDGYYKITFSELRGSGFKWTGAWVSTDESVEYPTWKISCTKKEAANAETEKELIRSAMKKFSEAYVNKEYEVMVDSYTPDGKIFPNNTSIIEGKEAIKQRWILPEGVSVTSHELQPVGITVLGDTAYDFGYYEGNTRNAEGEDVPWKGKYVVVWKKHEGDWKMYLDIWNRVID